MSKKLFLFILISSGLFAKSPKQFPFFGIQTTDQRITLNGTIHRDTSIGIRYGKQTLDWRTMFTYDYSKKAQMLTMEIDKILSNTLFGSSKVRPYVGFSIGATKIEDASLNDNSGYSYGGSAGLIIYASDTVDVDVSYYYNEIQEIQNAKTMRGVKFSLHYFF